MKLCRMPSGHIDSQKKRPNSTVIKMIAANGTASLQCFGAASAATAAGPACIQVAALVNGTPKNAATTAPANTAATIILNQRIFHLIHPCANLRNFFGNVNHLWAMEITFSTACAMFRAAQLFGYRFFIKR